MSTKLHVPPYRTGYRVMRTTGSTATVACRHRWERVAWWCARRRDRNSGIGVYHEVRLEVTA